MSFHKINYSIPLFLSALILLACSGCTRDDICAAETETTPKLIIVFKDFANPLADKAVTNLMIETTEAPNTPVFLSATSDSIAIPLKTGDNITKLRFSRDINGPTANSDVMTFSYLREDIYVNRACGFKIIYTNFSAIRENEGSANWIQNFDVLKTNIDNEESAHLVIFH